MTRYTRDASAPAVAEIAALVGDPARSTMLAALMDGRALTATELALEAGVAPPTASGHLAKLAAGGLLALEKQGRHRYYRLASPLVGRMLEGVMALAALRPSPTERPRATPRVDERMRLARTCYDHLAGRIGVGIADALIANGHLVLSTDGGELTEPGRERLAALGIEVAASSGRRAFCRPCLDWTERRHHLAGSVGAAICTHTLERGWLRRVTGTRALSLTPDGARALRHAFGVTEGMLAQVER